MASLPGRLLFDSLSGILFVFCLVEGVRQTADCLSQEKREGTLGLLFLTELSGRDVVLGKLAATSLGSFFALLAAFSVLAVALPAGGVTAGEFWRTALVLLSTLLAGLAWGMWASARRQIEGRSLLLGLGAAFAFALVPWIFEYFLRWMGLPNFSLSVALQLAGDTEYFAKPARFWMTLLLAHGLGWALLAAAGRIVESGWREESQVACEPATPAAYVPRWSGASPELPRIQEYWPVRMMDDPAGWLAHRQLRYGHLIWLALVATGFGSYVTMFLLRLLPAASITGLYTAIDLASEFLPIGLLLFITSRCFAEGRRGGDMEMILSTPLSSREIVLGHWRALWGRLRAPFIVVMVLLGLITLLRLSGADFFFASDDATTIYLTTQSAKRVLCGVAACWLGLYLGLRMGSAQRAVGYGVLWLVIVPWMASWIIWVLHSRLLLSGRVGTSPVWYWWGCVLALSPVVLGSLYLGGVIWWSRRQLIKRLRELAARG
jgi:ABC-type transport system involved in multi-copper enzyme maturation permease subunit